MKTFNLDKKLSVVCDTVRGKMAFLMWEKQFIMINISAERKLYI
jgi:hypothetical protein